jgi:hypothetical protein
MWRAAGECGLALFSAEVTSTSFLDVPETFVCSESEALQSPLFFRQYGAPPQYTFIVRPHIK